MYILLIVLFNKNFKFLTLKYFIVQRLSSGGMFLVNVLLIIRARKTLYGFLILFLFIKLGISPFHFWFIYMGFYLDYFTLFLIIRFQKFGGWLLYLQFNFQDKFLMFFLLRLIFSLYLLSQVKRIKLVLLFSSIFSIIWFILIKFYFRELLIIYIIYRLILFRILSIMFIRRTSYLNTFFYRFWDRKIFKILLLWRFSGLPPFLGFFLKVKFLLNLITLGFFVLWRFIFRRIVLLYFYFSYFYERRIYRIKFWVNNKFLEKNITGYFVFLRLRVVRAITLI